jgi:uncharacterized protein with HEPN domain
MLRDEDLLIKDIREEISYVKELIKGFDYNDFKKDKKTRRTVMFSLIVIGEACGVLQKKYQKKIDSLLFHFKKNRNEITHKYWIEIPEIQWSLVKDKLPILEKELKKEEVEK